MQVLFDFAILRFGPLRNAFRNGMLIVEDIDCFYPTLPSYTNSFPWQYVLHYEAQVGPDSEKCT